MNLLKKIVTGFMVIGTFAGVTAACLILVDVIKGHIMDLEMSPAYRANTDTTVLVILGIMIGAGLVTGFLYTKLFLEQFEGGGFRKKPRSTVTVLKDGKWYVETKETVR